MLPPELYGPAGAIAALAFVLLLLVRGDLAPGVAYKREVERGDRLEKALFDVLRKSGEDGK